MCIYEKSSTTQTVVFIGEKGIFWCILQSVCDWDSTPYACGTDLYINGLLSPVSAVMKNGQVLCVLYNLSSETWLKQCWEWRKWETIFIWSAYYLCTYSECEGKSHCKYVLLCNLYCNYMNRCNNVALTIIIFGGKDWPLDKKKTWHGVKFIYWSYCIYCNNKHVPITTVHILCMTMLQIKGNQLRQLRYF